MGYRSQVTVALYEEDYKKMIKAALNHEEKDAIIDLLNYAHLYKQSADGENVVLLEWNSVKWYDGYCDVDFVMDFLHKDYEMPFAFCRVGEEVDDIETDCNNDENWTLGCLSYPRSYICVDCDNKIDAKDYIQHEMEDIQRA